MLFYNTPLFSVVLLPITLFFFFLILFIYLFIYFYFWLCWVFGSCEGFLQLRQVGATLHRGARAFHYRGPSRCGAQAPDAQAQQLWLTGPAAPWHVGSSQTRARTRVSCISRQILNHCATREALPITLDYFYLLYVILCDNKDDRLLIFCTCCISNAFFSIKISQFN